MINPIAPHGPVQDLSGQPAPGGSGGDDRSFDDFLPGRSPSGDPTLPDDYATPNATPKDPRTPDPMRPLMPHPVRWKDAKNSSVGLGGSAVPLPPAPVPLPTDPTVGIPVITLAPQPSLPALALQGTGTALTDSGWTLEVPNSQVNGTATTTGTLLRGADASSSPTTIPGPVRPLAYDRLSALVGADNQANPAAVSLPGRLVPPNAGAPAASVGTAVAADPGTTAPAEPMAVDSQRSGASIGLIPAAPYSQRAPELATTVVGLTVPLPATLPSPPANQITPPVPAVDPASSLQAVVTRPNGADPTSETPLASGPPLALSVADARQTAPDPRAASRTASATSPVAPADLRSAAPRTPPAGQDLAPVATPPSLLTSEAVVAAVLDRANIAGQSASATRFVQGPELNKSQPTAQEAVAQDIEIYGTSVAKDESAVNATLPRTQTETNGSPLPKRGGPAGSGVLSTGQPGSDRSPGSVVVDAMSVPGSASVNATLTSTPQPSIATPSATAQAVKVESLLQHAMNVAESARPNGTNQLEMRVSLNGGNEDVTVQMQVVNDRMQVTFQTNSAELRKALEHGWEQFSAGASQSSTLSIGEARFEPGPVSAASPGVQAETQSFSSSQQNPDRQEATNPLADEPAPPAPSRRASFSSAVAPGTAAGQAASRGWSGWA